MQRTFGGCAFALLSQLHSADGFDAFCVEVRHSRPFTAANREQRRQSAAGKRGGRSLAKPCAATLIRQRALNAKPLPRPLPFRIEHADQLLGRRAVLAEVRSESKVSCALSRPPPHAAHWRPGLWRTPHVCAASRLRSHQTPPAAGPPAQNRRSGDKALTRLKAAAPPTICRRSPRKHIVVSAPGRQRPPSAVRPCRCSPAVVGAEQRAVG